MSIHNRPEAGSPWRNSKPKRLLPLSNCFIQTIFALARLYERMGLTRLAEAPARARVERMNP